MGLIITDLNEPFKRRGVQVTKVEDVEPVLRYAANRRKHYPKGYDGRTTMRLIGTIPAVEALRHPEILRDEDAMTRFLRVEGAAYRTVERL